MAKGSLFVGWGEIIHGREKAAQATLNNAMQYIIPIATGRKDRTL